MREVARRVFAKEYAQSDLQERAGDTEYAPSYIVTPTGARCNRLFIIGVLTEVSDIGKDKELYRARVSDPTGTFLLYAGNFQPEATKYLSEAQPPKFVAVTGKTNLYEPDEETSITSIRPEVINESNEMERDRWTVKTAEMTLDRIKNIDEKTKKHYNLNKEEFYDIIKTGLTSVVEERETQETEEESTIEEEKEKEGEKEDKTKGDLEFLEEEEKESESKKKKKTENGKEEEGEEVEELDLSDI